MSSKKQIITAFVYICVTFLFAIIWHLVVFKSFYERIGYFGDEDPIIALGLLTIIIQGVLVGYAYPFFQRGGKASVDAIRVSIVFGVNTASIHVLAAAAKHHAPASTEWFLMEGCYFLIQFSLLALMFTHINKSKTPQPNA